MCHKRAVLLSLCMFCFVLLHGSVFLQTDDFPAHAAWSNSGTKMAIGYQSGVVEILDANTVSVSLTFDGPITALAWSSTDDELAIAYYPGQFALYSISQESVTFDRLIDDGEITHVLWSDQDSVILNFRDARGDRGNLVQMSLVDLSIEANGPRGGFSSIEQLSGSRIAVTYFAGYISMLDNQTLTETSRQAVDVPTVLEMTWNDTESLVAIGGQTGVAAVYEYQNNTFTLVRQLQPNGEPTQDAYVVDVYFLTDDVLEVATADGMIREWDIVSGELLSETNMNQPLRDIQRNPVDDSVVILGDDEVTVTPSTLPAPSNFTITASPPVGLVWQDNSADETGFIVARQIDGGEWQDIATLPANTTTYTDVACGSLAYQVRATRQSPLPLDSIPSNEVSVSVACNE